MRGRGGPPSPSPPSAGACGSAGASASPPIPRPRGSSSACRVTWRLTFEPGRRFANEVDFHDHLDRWFDERANLRAHRALRCRPIDRLGEDLAAMSPLPAEVPDLDPRIVLRVPPDPCARVDTCDYSLDPRRVGRRVEVRVGQAEITAVVLAMGEIAAAHRRSYACHRTITDLAHARTLREVRWPAGEPDVEQRPLARYDALIPA